MTRTAGNKINSRTFQGENLTLSGIFKDMATFQGLFKGCASHEFNNSLINDNHFTQGLPLLCQKLDQPSCSLHVPSAGLLLSTVVKIKREATC